MYVEDQLLNHFKDLINFVKKAEASQKQLSVPEGSVIPGMELGQHPCDIPASVYGSYITTAMFVAMLVEVSLDGFFSIPITPLLKTTSTR